MSQLPSQSPNQSSLTNDQQSLGRQIAIYALGIVVAIAVGWALDFESTYGVVLGMATVAALRIAYLIWQRQRT